MILENNLIKKCTCGNKTMFTALFVNLLEVVSCEQCNVIHQLLDGWSKEDYYNFYKTDYHKKYQEEKGVITYQDRYEHDCRVADMRLDAYQLPEFSVGLDIGSSNTAFVHRARERNISCLGLEPGTTVGDDTVTIRGTLESAYLNPNHFDFVTMHDSIEHMVDVNSALQKVHSILKPGGQLILDLPDYFSPSGSHHWKRIEHLWFFTEDQFLRILENNGYKTVKTTTPIPGKLVYYTRKV
jgi:SAM-dependent methyltransferase